MGRKGTGEAGELARAVADVVAELIEGSGRKVKDVTDAADMSSTYLYTRLRGESPFSLNDIEALGRAVGIHPSSILLLAAGTLDEIDPDVIASRVRLVLSAPLLNGDVFTWAGFARKADRAKLSDDDLTALAEGRIDRPIPTVWLTKIAAHWSIDPRFLLDPTNADVDELIRARLELRRVFSDAAVRGFAPEFGNEESLTVVKALVTVMTQSNAEHAAKPDADES